MKTLTLLAFSAAFAVAMLGGCAGDSAETTDGTDTAATTTTPGTTTPAEISTPAPSGDSATAGAERTFTFKGTVTKIDRERNRITLNHEKIGDWMDAMTMPFPVADPGMLDQVEEQKEYTFTIVVAADDTYKLTSITQ